MSGFIGLLKGHAPEKDWFRSDVSIPKNAAEQFASIYIAEALPVAFTEHLPSYDRARKILANALRVDYRDIQITGSAKLGFSLSPDKYLKDFDPGSSDIVLFVVNKYSYDAINRDAKNFCDSVASGELTANRDRKQKIWEENVAILRRNAPHSFIDAKYIPSIAKFPEAQKTHEAAYKFIVNLSHFSKVTLAKKCSIRVYANWGAAMRRISYNICSAHQKCNSP